MQRLNIECCFNITDTTLQIIAAQCPNLEVFLIGGVTRIICRNYLLFLANIIQQQEKRRQEGVVIYQIPAYYRY